MLIPSAATILLFELGMKVVLNCAARAKIVLVWESIGGCGGVVFFFFFLLLLFFFFLIKPKLCGCLKFNNDFRQGLIYNNLSISKIAYSQAERPITYVLSGSDNSLQLKSTPTCHSWAKWCVKPVPSCGVIARTNFPLVSLSS